MAAQQRHYAGSGAQGAMGASSTRTNRVDDFARDAVLFSGGLCASALVGARAWSDGVACAGRKMCLDACELIRMRSSMIHPLTHSTIQPKLRAKYCRSTHCSSFLPYSASSHFSWLRGSVQQVDDRCAGLAWQFQGCLRRDPPANHKPTATSLLLHCTVPTKLRSDYPGINPSRTGHFREM